MSRKSDCKRLLRELCPDAREVFIQGEHTDTTLVPTAPLVLEDGLVALRVGIAPRTYTDADTGEERTREAYTWRDYIRVLARPISESFERPLTGGIPAECDDRRRRYGLVFDKSEFVPITKDLTHQRRALLTVAELEVAHATLLDTPTLVPADDAKRTAKLARLAEQLAVARENDEHRARVLADPSLIEDAPLDDVMPYAIWEHMMHDRTCRRPLVIRKVVRHLLEASPDTGISLPVGCMLFVDGHNLTLADAKRLFPRSFVANPERERERGDDEHRNVPLAVLARDGRMVVSFLYQLHNTIGEADLSLFFFAHYYRERAKRVLIRSTDTDVMLIALLYLAKADDADDQQLYVTYPNQGRRANVSDERTWFHANAMHRRVCVAMQSTVGAPVRTLVTALVLAGGDYTASFYGVPHKHFMAAALALSRDLLKGDASTTVHTAIDADAFERLVHVAYYNAHRRSFAGDAATTTPADAVIARTLGTRIHAEKRRMRTDAQLAQRICHLAYVMRMWLTVGDDSTLHLIDPLRYGYALVDVERGRVKGNLRMVFDDDDAPAAKRARAE